MTVSKLTNNVKPLDEVDKINEIIDELDNIDPLPSQTGQSGKYLTTNGTVPSWADVQSLPSQTGKAGKFLQTDGTDASWESAPFRNIGEIVSSTIPLTDAGLHLLDGALIQGDGIYSAFVDYIAGLVSTYPSVFTTESAWQSSVSTYGVCGKFVYDSTNNTVRLPKVTGIIEGTTDVNALGDLVQAGLPNITGKFGAMVPDYHSEKCSGVFAGTVIDNNSSFAWTSGHTDTNCFGYELNASRSSSIYGNSSTVQPQTIKCYYYIVIATSTKTDIQVDIDDIATDLNGKADRDLSNLNATGQAIIDNKADTDLTNVTDSAKVMMSGMGMPSDRFIDLTLGASGTRYTAPADGFFCIRKMANNLNEVVWMQNCSAGNLSGALNAATYVGMYLSAYIPIAKGNVMSLDYNATGSTQFFRFIYAVGSESEAS